MTSRSMNTYNKQVYEFIYDILVVCPSCSQKAIVLTPVQKQINQNEPGIKVVCTGCGYNKRLEEKPTSVLYSSSYKSIPGKHLVIGGAIDPYFHLPLWLAIDCCSQTLWAYNLDHLNFLKGHVEAKLRERNTQELSNSSMGSRLPKWMSSTKNREAVLKAMHLLNLKAL